MAFAPSHHNSQKVDPRKPQSIFSKLAVHPRESLIEPDSSFFPSRPSGCPFSLFNSSTRRAKASCTDSFFSSFRSSMLPYLPREVKLGRFGLQPDRPSTHQPPPPHTPNPNCTAISQAEQAATAALPPFRSLGPVDPLWGLPQAFPPHPHQPTHPQQQWQGCCIKAAAGWLLYTRSSHRGGPHYLPFHLILLLTHSPALQTTHQHSRPSVSSLCVV